MIGDVPVRREVVAGWRIGVEVVVVVAVVETVGPGARRARCRRIRSPAGFTGADAFARDRRVVRVVHDHRGAGTRIGGKVVVTHDVVLVGAMTGGGAVRRSYQH